MADADGFSRFLGIKPSLFPFDMDSIDDPKRFLIQMAGKSKKKELRKAIAPKPGSNTRVGPDYNGVLISFVYSDWDITRAIKRSKSLKHAVDAINNFQWLQ
jgi:hypothetical protein